MASINISEADFETLANAANTAHELGRHADANALDKLARKTNAALANRTLSEHRKLGFGHAPAMKWTDVPTTIIAS